MNDRENDYDAADQLERDVWEAIQRAKAGQATDDDWHLVEWAAGFTHSEPRKAPVQDYGNLPF